jgi:hypothetical protein
MPPEIIVEGERSFVEVLNDLFGNVQDIVRSEVHLAKAEATSELRSAKSTALGFGVALLAIAFATLFGLLSAMYALALVMTAWQAALVVAGAMALVGVIAYVIADRHMRTPRETAPQSAENKKEDLSWAEL